MENKKAHWITCLTCQGRGKKRRRPRKKIRLQYQRAIAQFEKMKGIGTVPKRPKGSFIVCVDCKGSGLTPSIDLPITDKENYPHIAIIGGGIGGVALAVACLHRGIPFTLYERDKSFDARSQGYGLTLQQATKAIKGLGLPSLIEGVISTRHLVHTTEGKVIGEWGMRKWMQSDTNKNPKRTNIHIARQSLRLALLKQLGGHKKVMWGHRLLSYTTSQKDGEKALLNFEVNGKIKQIKADLIVGADGIRSTVRKNLIGEQISPLQYLGCIVILGICPLSLLNGGDRSLLDGATVFQTANGVERIYMMPYTKDTVMWQLSFPMSEDDAIQLSNQGPLALKQEACRRTRWHDPIPQILTATDESLISGYPVYDRAILDSSWLKKAKQITLIGDAAHPMSPFKGQGANQALLDALALARRIFNVCGPYSRWREIGLRTSLLSDFESEMIARTTPKVKDSAAAVHYLHSDIVLHHEDAPRGTLEKKKNK